VFPCLALRMSVSQDVFSSGVENINVTDFSFLSVVLGAISMMFLSSRREGSVGEKGGRRLSRKGRYRGKETKRKRSYGSYP
jgi:hypothetical protein